MIAPDALDGLLLDQMLVGGSISFRITLADNDIIAGMMRDLLQQSRGRRGEDANFDAGPRAPQCPDIGDHVLQCRFAKHDHIGRHRVISARRRGEAGQ